jgi:hypothetical protein
VSDDQSATPIEPLSTAGLEEVACPRCGERQPRRTLCRACALDIPRFLAAQQQAKTEAHLARQARLDAPRLKKGDGLPSLDAEVSRQLSRWVAILFFGALILLLVSYLQRDAWPSRDTIRTELMAEPVQRQAVLPPIKATVGGINYEVQPLYSYDLYGLVVSTHDSSTWWDYIHRQWKDELNVMDACVVWGNNLRSGAFRDISFSSGQFVCNFETSSPTAYELFDQTAVSNNHLLTSNPAIAKAMRSARVGDQIHFRGYLAEYSHNHGFPFKRGTSTIRTDTGNGACETVYVEEFEILRRGGGWWRALLWFAWALLIASVVTWFALPAYVRR